MTSLLKQTGAS